MSALGGVTDLLLEALEQAANGDSNFSKTLKKIEERHLEPIRASIPAEKQSSVISFVKAELNHLETILDGVSMLREITPKTTAKVTSFGELLSSTIIHEILKNKALDVVLKDGRELIETQDQNHKSTVNWKATQTKIDLFFKTNSAKTTLVPGFVAQDSDGNLLP